ncbi:site-2 protease family protein [Candidatus Babeliales bacterium]|nr:site-2 protease family protein [Candidatus Babeliales bacterium]
MLSKEFIDFLASVAIIFPAFLIALSFHEFSHALVAYLLGDDTAKKLGRLTLNPFAHLDFWGTIFLIFVRIGWAKPVPFNLKNFKHPRIYSVLTALAGPFANFILVFVSFLLLKYFPLLGFSVPITTSFMQVFEVSATINAMLGTFNLLPIPPLDGSHFIFALLYKKFPQAIVWLYRYSFFLLIMILIIPFTRITLIKLIFYVRDLIRSLVF